MKKLILLLFLLVSSFASAQCLKADIIFILDWSASEDSNRVYIPMAAYDFVNTLSLGPSSVKIGIIPFDTEPLYSYCLKPSCNKETINSLLLSLMKTSLVGNTNFPDAFLLANEYFYESENERGEPAMRIIIFISDGDESWNTRDLTLVQAYLMKENGVRIWSLATPGINHAERLHMMRICSDPDMGYYLEEYYIGLREELLSMNICP